MTSDFRKRREALGLSQAELALRAGVSQSWVSKLESGRAIGSETLRRIEAVLADGPDAEPTGTHDVARDAPPELVRALNTAFDGRVHHFGDAAAIAEAFRGVSLPALPDAELQDRARVLLDAAAALRAEGRPVTLALLLMTARLGLK